ncbi:MAG: hypothetical protein ABI281_08030 [Caldimonas sp.]
MNVRHYTHFGTAYGGEAYASTLTAVRPPRPRALDFCIGDDRRSLIGKAGVGTEQHQFTEQVLELALSIRFTD